MTRHTYCSVYKYYLSNLQDIYWTYSLMTSAVNAMETMWDTMNVTNWIIDGLLVFNDINTIHTRNITAFIKQ